MLVIRHQAFGTPAPKRPDHMDSTPLHSTAVTLIIWIVKIQCHFMFVGGSLAASAAGVRRHERLFKAYY